MCNEFHSIIYIRVCVGTMNVQTYYIRHCAMHFIVGVWNINVFEYTWLSKGKATYQTNSINHVGVDIHSCITDCVSLYYPLYTIVGHIWQCNCHRGRDHMVVGFIATYEISTYYHWICEYESHTWRGVLDIMLCDTVLSVTCDRSVVFSKYSGFIHQWNWPPRYIWNVVESYIEHHNPNSNPILLAWNYLVPRPCSI